MAFREKKQKPQDWFACPNCGAKVPAGSPSCPECGSDDETGWAEGADIWSADIPEGYSGDDPLDYDDFLLREFGRPPTGTPAGRLKLLLALAVAIVVAILFILAIIHL
jgi:hypothetical protein